MTPLKELHYFRGHWFSRERWTYGSGAASVVAAVIAVGHSTLTFYYVDGVITVLKVNSVSDIKQCGEAKKTKY